MNQIWVRGSRSVGIMVWFGALALALAVVAGAAQAEAPPPTPLAEDPPVKETPRAPEKPVPVQPNVQLIHQPSVATPKAATRAEPQKINLLEEIITGAFILIVATGGVVAAAIIARLIFSITMPGDLRSMALRDPWVQAQLARQSTAAVETPQLEPTE